MKKGYKHTPQAILKMKESSKGVITWNKGQHYSPKTEFKNGRTLCIKCHRTTKTYGGRKENGMKETRELNYGSKATINLGNYENISPMFNIKRIIELNGEHFDYDKEFQEMREIVDSQLNVYVQQHKTKDFEVKFREKDGKKYVSVTQVISPEPYTGNPLYGERGTILHRVFEGIVTKGEYVWDVTDEEKKKLKPVCNIDDFHYKWIMEDKRFGFRNSERRVFNEEYLYSGRYDADGMFDGVPCIYDLKSGKMSKKEQDKAFMQMSAYINCIDISIPKMVIIPINPKDKQEPIVSDKIDFYYGRFIEKRLQFRKEYGV